MNEESFGIVPVQKRENGWHVLLIQHCAGHWSFPKGKKETGETALQTAERELHEETNLKVAQYLQEKPFCEVYTFTRRQKKIHKKVFYFLAIVEGSVVIQPEELLQARWVYLHEAFSYLTYPQAREILTQAQKLLN